MGKRFVCVEDAIAEIRHMLDYDGFRDGDCVSRRVVIGILDSMAGEETISRQEAIDAINAEYPEVHYPSWYAEKIKNL